MIFFHVVIMCIMDNTNNSVSQASGTRFSLSFLNLNMHQIDQYIISDTYHI